MKLFAFVAGLILVSPSVFAEERLCREEASKALKDQMKRAEPKSPDFILDGEPDYKMFKNRESTTVVRYEFNLILGVKSQEKRFARVTLTKRGCHFLASDSFLNRSMAEANDFDLPETSEE